jgi:hypothetical protein
MFPLSCKEDPLTEYEKVRARNIMRNNRMFQSLGIGAIASMIRKSNDVQEGRTEEVQEGSGVINDDPEYNPKEDEVIDGKEVDDVVVQKTVKVQTLVLLGGLGFLYALCFLVLTYLSRDLMLFSVLFIRGTEVSEEEAWC